MKLDNQGRLTIPITLFNYLNWTSSDSIKLAFHKNYFILFRVNDITMENVEFHRIISFDNRHRILVGKKFIEENNLAEKNLVIGVRGTTIVVHW